MKPRIVGPVDIGQLDLISFVFSRFLNLDTGELQIVIAGASFAGYDSGQRFW